jgi:hypothetical protein
VSDSIVEVVREAGLRQLLYLPHAVQQMSRPDRMITTAEVESVVFAGELIEDYPEDARGHSCLFLGRGQENRALHVLCSPKELYLSIITAYLPDPGSWWPDCKRRR